MTKSYQTSQATPSEGRRRPCKTGRQPSQRPSKHCDLIHYTARHYDEELAPAVVAEGSTTTDDLGRSSL